MEDDIPRWEYTQIGAPLSNGSPSKNTLDELGKEGWEAYATVPANSPQLLLKRKITKPKQKHDDYGYGR